jgi:hypothetical protein
VSYEFGSTVPNLQLSYLCHGSRTPVVISDLLPGSLQLSYLRHGSRTPVVTSDLLTGGNLIFCLQGENLKSAIRPITFDHTIFKGRGTLRSWQSLSVSNLAELIAVMKGK